LRKIKLVIAYEGTLYAGWQSQKNARTIQKTLEQAFAKILQEKVKIVGASRTDSGVHACAQGAHATIRSRMPLSKLLRALNAVLPEDILVRSLKRAPGHFHARYSAKKKWYRYTIWNKKARPLFERPFVHHVPQPLSLAAMRKAMRGLTGRRDFGAFHSSGRTVASTIRRVSKLTLRAQEGRITIDVEADGFLYHMVRRMVGFLLEIGKGKGPPAVAPTAPAKGLCLMRDPEDPS
jgi:tRNA pseudouridine38-40 synthase